MVIGSIRRPSPGHGSDAHRVAPEGAQRTDGFCGPCPSGPILASRLCWPTSRTARRMAGCRRTGGGWPIHQMSQVRIGASWFGPFPTRRRRPCSRRPRAAANLVSRQHGALLPNGRWQRGDVGPLQDDGVICARCTSPCRRGAADASELGRVVQTTMCRPTDAASSSIKAPELDIPLAHGRSELGFGGEGNDREGRPKVRCRDLKRTCDHPPSEACR